MSNKIVEYKDLIAFHPGQYVEELIEDYNVTQKEFAERLGVSAKTVSKLVNAEESISKETAHKLAKLSGVSMQTWLNLQNAYDVKVAEIVEQKELEEGSEKEICEMIYVELDDLDELDNLADLAVRALDALLDYQDYPVPAAKRSSLGRRSLGIGVINYAYYLAKNGVRYSDGSANDLTHRTFEAIQYYLLKASMNLAKELGACEYFNETNYAKGILPIDTYKKDIDSLTQEPLHYDWETLRHEIKEFGLRNSTLTALMPSETSSQISNATNGIEPPRGHVSIKASKDGILKQVVPDYENLSDNYELLWDIPSNDGYLHLVGIMQKFVDQAISANTNYDPKRFEDGKVPMKVLLKDLLTAYKYGLKTLYYQNTRDGAEDSQEDLDDGCAGGACKI